MLKNISFLTRRGNIVNNIALLLILITLSGVSCLSQGPTEKGKLDSPIVKSDKESSLPNEGESIRGQFSPTTSTPTPPAIKKTVKSQSSNPSAIVRDHDFENTLSKSSIRTTGWKTDFALHTVPFSEIRTIVQKDAIPSIDKPLFISIEEASEWLHPKEPVISVQLNGTARAYPVQILTWHEIVNDKIGESEITVTFCPLCNSAIVFDASLNGVTLKFGVSGNLRNSDLIMFDKKTHSWWQQLTGECLVGTHAGLQLKMLPSTMTSFSEFSSAFPDGLVLSKTTGHIREYGQNPYPSYDAPDSKPFLFFGAIDDRLPAKERVVAMTVDSKDIAIPFSLLTKARVLQFMLGENELAVFFEPQTLSPLDKKHIPKSRDIGSTGVFTTHINGRKLNFKSSSQAIIDIETQSVWNIFGEAISGPLSGEQLTPILHANHFWFTWSAFKPQTEVYSQEAQSKRDQ